MAAIILPHRWRRQPDAPVEIDQASRLLNGRLISGWSALNGLYTFGRAAYRGSFSASNVSIGSAPGGLALSLANPSGQLNIHNNPDLLFPTNDRTTLAIFRQSKDTTNRVSALIGYNNGAGSRVLCHMPYSDGNAYWDFGSFSTGRLSVAFAKTTEPETIVLIAGPNVGREIWRNGVRIANNASVTATRPSVTSGTCAIGNNGTESADNEWVYLALVVDDEWQQGQVQAFSENPWQVFAPLRRRLYFASSAAAAEITGTAAITEAPDSISAAASVAITANASLSEVADSISAAASVLVTATAALQEAADAISASAGTAAFAEAAIVEAADSVSASASVAITATSAIVEHADQTTSAGAVAIVATAALQEQADRISAEGGSASFATASLVEAADALAATGTVLVTGTASLSEQADALASAVMVSLTATAALLEAADSIAASGSVGTVVSTADAALVEAPDTSTGAATVAVTGAAAIVEAGDIVVSGVSLVVTATAVLVEQADSITAAGSALNALTATASLIEANDTMTATVVQKIARWIAVSDAISGGRPAASDARRWTITPSDGLN